MGKTENLALFLLVFTISGWWYAINSIHRDEVVRREQHIENLKRVIDTLEKEILEKDKTIENLRQELSKRDKISTSRGGGLKLSKEDMARLARVVHAEAKNQPELGKMLVARVALNRLAWNPGMTMEQILTNRNAFAAPEAYDAEDWIAVTDALADKRFLHLAGFHNPKTATDPEAKKHKILLEVGDHVFW